MYLGKSRAAHLTSPVDARRLPPERPAEAATELLTVGDAWYEQRPHGCRQDRSP